MEYDSDSESSSNAKSRKVSIIAMKGHPFTRKTEFATTIAISLRCPLLSLEDVLKYKKPPLSPEQELEAFRGVCENALHHLQTSASKSVVIDSPLSSQSFLNQLNSLAYELRKMEVRVIIVECKPASNYTWRMKFEDRLAKFPPKDEEWHKPKNWNDIKKAIEDTPDFDIETSVLGPKYVSKLVIDPIVDCPIQNRVISLRDTSHDQLDYENPDLVRAIQYMTTRNEGVGPDVVVYLQWLAQSKYQSSSSPIHAPYKYHCSNYGHDIVPSSRTVKQETADYEVVPCRACQKPISRSDLQDAGAYCYCRNCDLDLHMECAKNFVDDPQARKRGYKFSDELGVHNKTFACNPCRNSGKDGFFYCKTCVFDAHLRSPLYPTVIEHLDTESHFLNIWFKEYVFYPTLSTFYPCFACGEKSGSCMYLCKDHGETFCYECVTLPRLVKDEHGGHHHTLSLRFTCEEEEDYLCQECQELRNPTLWYYSCDECPGYDLHPYCVDAIRPTHPDTMKTNIINGLIAQILGASA